MWSSGGQSTTCYSIGSGSNLVIIIQFTTTNQTADQIANEIKRVTGVDVQVIEVNKQTFEVTIINGGTTDLIDLAKKIQDAIRNGNSELLRQITNIDIRAEALSTAASNFLINIFFTFIIVAVVSFIV